MKLSLLSKTILDRIIVTDLLIMFSTTPLIDPLLLLVRVVYSLTQTGLSLFKQYFQYYQDRNVRGAKIREITGELTKLLQEMYQSKTYGPNNTSTYMSNQPDNILFSM